MFFDHLTTPILEIANPKWIQLVFSVNTLTVSLCSLACHFPFLFARNSMQENKPLVGGSLSQGELYDVHTISTEHFQRLVPLSRVLSLVQRMFLGSSSMLVCAHICREAWSYPRGARTRINQRFVHRRFKDLLHSPSNLDTHLYDLSNVVAANGASPIVRVPAEEPWLIKVFLEIYYISIDPNYALR